MTGCLSLELNKLLDTRQPLHVLALLLVLGKVQDVASQLSIHAALFQVVHKRRLQLVIQLCEHLRTAEPASATLAACL